MTEKLVPEMSPPTSVCPTPELWSAWDNMATEVEVLEFLCALVYMLKPQIIVETGCYHGHGTEQLIRGCMMNHFGTVYTCDMDVSCVMKTHDRINSTAPFMSVMIKQCSGIELIEGISKPIDFAFLDSGGDEVRCHELKVIYPKLSPGAIVAIHDTGIQGFLREKYLPPLLRELGMQFVFFDTPRGITLCRKQPEIYP
jgi:predicted O-methyltransferase YrrM